MDEIKNRTVDSVVYKQDSEEQDGIKAKEQTRNSALMSWTVGGVGGCDGERDDGLKGQGMWILTMARLGRPSNRLH